MGVYALIRMFTLVFDHDIAFTQPILLWVAALTMITGVLGAASQTDFRKILSFHIVSQIGYNDPRAGAADAAGDHGGGVLPDPPYHREGEPLS